MLLRFWGGVGGEVENYIGQMALNSNLMSVFPVWGKKELCSFKKISQTSAHPCLSARSVFDLGIVLFEKERMNHHLVSN